MIGMESVDHEKWNLLLKKKKREKKKKKSVIEWN